MPFLIVGISGWAHTRVAAQVHDETTADPTRPDLTVLPAVLNISDVCSSLLYRLRMNVTSIMPVAVSVGSCLGTRGSLLSRHTHGKQSAEANDNAIADTLIQSSVYHLVVAEGTSSEETGAECFFPITTQRVSLSWDLRDKRVRGHAAPV